MSATDPTYPAIPPSAGPFGDQPATAAEFRYSLTGVAL
jgi:hypothetical protein